MRFLSGAQRLEAVEQSFACDQGSATSIRPCYYVNEAAFPQRSLVYQKESALFIIELDKISVCVGSFEADEEVRHTVR